jgi:hypothetical protein
LFALAGTSVAAIQQLLPRNSVGTAQVRNNSLLRVDFRRGQIPAGPRGRTGARGPAGAAGAAGPAGPAGPAGAAGAAGTAKAFARVLAGGDVDDTRAKGINDAAVSKPTGSTGVYCIDVEGGALNAVATPDISSGAGETSASVLLSTCPSGKEVEVHTYDSAGTAGDRPFYVLVN